MNSGEQERPKVKSQTKKPWQELCEQAAIEQDPQRLMELVGEISQLLDQQMKLPQKPDAA